MEHAPEMLQILEPLLDEFQIERAAEFIRTWTQEDDAAADHDDIDGDGASATH